MIYYNYFIEIKNRIILILFSWIISFLISYYYKEIILFLITKSNLKILKNFYFITTNITDMLYIYLKLSYFVSFQIICLFLIYHIIMFLSPGLYFNEYNKIKLSIILLINNFIFINYFYSKYLFPFIWFFLINYHYSHTTIIKIYLESQIIDFIQFYCINYYFTYCLSLFILTLLFYLVSKKNQIFFIKKYRKIFYTFFIFQSTFLTPPDVFSQIFVSIGLIIIYEFMIIIAILVKHLIKLRQPIKAN